MLLIRPMQVEDIPRVVSIYEEGIVTGNATFNTHTPTVAAWDSSHLLHTRLVAVGDGNHIAGWAALLPVSPRECFKGVAEESIYIGEGFRGKGVGKELLSALIDESERNGMWMLQAAIFPENLASLAIHYKAGFRQVGIREKIASLHGIWRDTVLLERRSKVVGV